jgi:hypothetical protein
MEDPMAAHSNLYVRGWSADQFCEADLVQLFAAHGEITSLRMVAGGENGQAAPHAFVKMERPAQVRGRLGEGGEALKPPPQAWRKTRGCQ